MNGMLAENIHAGFITSARVFFVNACSQCFAEVPDLVVDCAVDARWMWCFQCQRRQDFSSPVGDHGKHSRSQLVLSRSSCQFGFSVRVEVSSCDPTKHRVTILVVLSVDLIGVERTRSVPP